MPSEIRQDELQQYAVIITGDSGKQTPDLERPEHLNHQATACPFCPNAVNPLRALQTVGPKDAWHVKVIASREPLASPDNAKAYGQDEIIIETPHHLRQIDELPIEHLERWLETCAHRCRTMAQDPKISCIQLFKTSGRAQSPIKHSHAHILGTAMMPPAFADREMRAQSYQKQHGTCVACDILKKEQNGQRAIWQNDHFLAFAPFASLHNYELCLMPKRHINALEALNEQERQTLAQAIKELTRAINDLHLPYHFSFHQIPRSTTSHLFFKLAPRGKVWAGPELDEASGMRINAVSPEAAARYYREALKKS